MILNRAPGVVWALRMPLECGYVRTLEDELIQVLMPMPDETRAPCFIYMNRKDARLLAKRINQCLDETRL